MKAGCVRVPILHCNSTVIAIKFIAIIDVSHIKNYYKIIELYSMSHQARS